MKRVAARWFLLAGLAASSGCLRERPDVQNGAIVYQRYCAVCHGLEGRGDGPAAVALTPRPTDLTRLTDGVVELMRRIDGRAAIPAHGSEAMPVWGEVFARGLVGEGRPAKKAKLHVQAAALYVRSLQRPAQ
jgi:mono/diheme cytochrome c family protein